MPYVQQGARQIMTSYALSKDNGNKTKLKCVWEITLLHYLHDLIHTLPVKKNSQFFK